jgi:hypothetical protein
MVDFHIHPTSNSSLGALIGSSISAWQHCQLCQGVEIDKAPILCKGVYFDR